MKEKTLHDFKKGRTVCDYIFSVIKRLLGFTFLLVVFG